jgi:hypothetical protein
MVARVVVALASLLANVAPSVVQDGGIAATFYQAPGAAQQSKAAAALPNNAPGAFKADPEVPIHVEADKLVWVFDGAKRAVFSRHVKSQQGDFVLKTTTLTAFYLGQCGFSDDGEWWAEQFTRAEASEVVFVKSKDGQTTPTGDWATLNVEGDIDGPRRRLARQGRRPGTAAEDRSDDRHVPL